MLHPACTVVLVQEHSLWFVVKPNVRAMASGNCDVRIPGSELYLLFFRPNFRTSFVIRGRNTLTARELIPIVARHVEETQKRK